MSKEKNGTYTVQCWYGEHLTWERNKKTKCGFARKADAAQWERDFLMKAAGSTTMNFGDFFQVYKADVITRFKLNTWCTKESVIRNKILPLFGDMRLSDIAPADVLAWQTKLMSYVDPKTGKRYKKTYLRTVNNTLSSIMNHVVHYYGLPREPHDEERQDRRLQA